MPLTTQQRQRIACVRDRTVAYPHRDWLLGKILGDLEPDPNGHHLSSPTITAHYMRHFPLAADALFAKAGKSSVATFAGAFKGRNAAIFPALAEAFYPGAGVSYRVDKEGYLGPAGQTAGRNITRFNLKPRAHIAPLFGVQPLPTAGKSHHFVLFLPATHAVTSLSADDARQGRNEISTCARKLVSHTLHIPTGNVVFERTLAHPRALPEIAPTETVDHWLARPFGTYSHVPLLDTHFRNDVEDFERALPTLLNSTVPRGHVRVFIFPSITQTPLSLRSLARLASKFRSNGHGWGRRLYFGFGVSGDSKEATWTLNERDTSQIIMIRWSDLNMITDKIDRDSLAWPLSQADIEAAGVSTDCAATIAKIEPFLQPTSFDAQRSRAAAFGLTHLFPGHELDIRP